MHDSGAWESVSPHLITDLRSETQEDCEFRERLGNWHYYRTIDIHEIFAVIINIDIAVRKLNL